MTLAVRQSISAVAPKIPASFGGVGGVAPYLYSVVADGAGGSINPETGMYTAPSYFTSDPSRNYDTILVTDASGATATAMILVATPLLLVCDIIQKELGLANGRVWLWDQKIMQPKDFGLYIAISVPLCKPFGNVNRFVDGKEDQSVNMFATLDIDIISRGPEARDRKEEVILALKSSYAQSQQEANSFHLATISSSFLNLSQLDGSAIPYRYKISVNMQYAFVKPEKNVPYYEDFQEPLLLFDEYDPREGMGIRTVYGLTPVGTTDWKVLVPKLKHNIDGLSVFDSSGQTMEIGICNYNAPPNSEESILIVNPGGLAPLEIEINFTQRISIRAVSAPAVTGENDLNLFLKD